MRPVPDPDTLLQWLDAGDAELDALEADLEGAGPLTPAERTRADRLHRTLDRAMAPEGLDEAVLDAVHAALRRPISRRRWVWSGAGLLATAMAAAALLFAAPSLELVTAEEAALAPMGDIIRGADAAAPVQGPHLAAEAAVSRWTGGVDLHISVKPGPTGTPVASGSLRVVYQRGDGIDVTGRLGITDETRELSLSGLSLPAGEHAFALSVADVEGHQSVERLHIAVP